MKRRALQKLIAKGTMALLCAVSLMTPFTAPAHEGNHEIAPISTDTRDGRLAVFDDAWSTINERYYDRAFNGLDWDAQREAFRAQAADAENTQQFYAVLRKMIQGLNDPHTRIYSPEEKFDWWRPRFVTIGLSVKEIDGLVTVVRVDPKSPPARAGIRPGDVIESVDGQTPTSLVQNQLVTETMSAFERARAAAAIFEGPAGSSLSVGWQDKHGLHRQARFARYWQERDLDLNMSLEKRRDLVISIDVFTNSTVVNFARRLHEKLKGNGGVVIDLRDNGGGDAEAMAELAALFLGNGIDLGAFTDRSGGGFDVFTNSQSLPVAAPLALRIPLVVLTSERTSSAAEIFVAALRRAGRAKIIGTQTCGCVLAIRSRHNLPDGGLLDVSEMDYKTAAGLRIEQHGIQPDQTILVHRQDLYARRDAALAAALSLLATKAQSEPSLISSTKPHN